MRKEVNSLLIDSNLAENESFEILWAKRIHRTLAHSYNYWFSQG